MACKHNYKKASSAGCAAHAKTQTHKSSLGGSYECVPLTFGEKCRKCGSVRTRPATREERKEYQAQQKEENAHCKRLFSLVRLFWKTFKNEDGSWKHTGYEMMKRVDKFAKKHTEVVITTCDDTCFSSSYIVLIPQKDDLAKRKQDEYFGTTAVIIPQLDDQPPVEFFLYPSHRKRFVKALQQMK